MLPPAVVGCTGRSSQLHLVVTSCCWPFEAETPNFFIDVLFGVGVYYLRVLSAWTSLSLVHIFQPLPFLLPSTRPNDRVV